MYVFTEHTTNKQKYDIIFTECDCINIGCRYRQNIKIVK